MSPITRTQTLFALKSLHLTLANNDHGYGTMNKRLEPHLLPGMTNRFRRREDEYLDASTH